MKDGATKILTEVNIDVSGTLDKWQQNDKKLTTDGALLILTLKVAAQFGIYSPAYLAMNFLRSVRSIEDNSTPSEFLDALAMADAWQQFHFEIFGEHERVVSAINSERGRAAGPEKRANNSHRTNDVIAKFYHDNYTDDHYSKFSNNRLAGFMFDHVNKALEGEGLPPLGRTAM